MKTCSIPASHALSPPTRAHHLPIPFISKDPSVRVRRKSSKLFRLFRLVRLVHFLFLPDPGPSRGIRYLLIYPLSPPQRRPVRNLSTVIVWTVKICVSATELRIRRIQKEVEYTRRQLAYLVQLRRETLGKSKVGLPAQD